MFGKSWGGFNGLQIASMDPEGLKAIISVYSTDDRYDDNSHYKGGCVVASSMFSGRVRCSRGTCRLPTRSLLVPSELPP